MGFDPRRLTAAKEEEHGHGTAEDAEGAPHAAEPYARRACLGAVRTDKVVAEEQEGADDIDDADYADGRDRWERVGRICGDVLDLRPVHSSR